jgi:hypothetical protein
VLILEIAAGIVLAVIVIVCWQIFAILALVGAVLFGLAVLYASTSPEVFSITLLCLIGLGVVFIRGWSAYGKTESTAVVVEADRPRHARLIDLVILGTAGVLLTGLAILSAIALDYGGAVMLGVVSAPVLLNFFRRWRGIRPAYGSP